MTPLLDHKPVDKGLLLRIEGYKGYSLSNIVSLLAGTLNGATMGKAVIDLHKDERSINYTLQAFMAIVFKLGAISLSLELRLMRWCES